MCRRLLCLADTCCCVVRIGTCVPTLMRGALPLLMVTIRRIEQCLDPRPTFGTFEVDVEVAHVADERRLNAGRADGDAIRVRSGDSGQTSPKVVPRLA